MEIKLKNLSRVYRPRKGIPVHALKDVTLAIPSNSMCSIMGPSGCGKTTLLNLIACMDTATQGEIYFDDECVSIASDARRAEIRNKWVGMVFQDFGLIGGLNVWENIRIPLLFARNIGKKEEKRRIDECMEIVGIKELKNQIVETLSGGQRQRVAIARSLIMKPPLLLADEPTGSLDSKATDEVMQLFKQLYESGMTLLIVTHSHHISEQCPVRYAMLDGSIQ